jgi:hypothetical protein
MGAANADPRLEHFLESHILISETNGHDLDDRWFRQRRTREDAAAWPLIPTATMQVLGLGGAPAVLAIAQWEQKPQERWLGLLDMEYSLLAGITPSLGQSLDARTSSS